MDIVIVDDEPKIRNGLSKLLDGRGNWHVTGTYADAMDALKNMAFCSPDVIITDIRPNRSALEECWKQFSKSMLFLTGWDIRFPEQRATIL